MLIELPENSGEADWILRLISSMNGSNFQEELRTGIYKVGHFGSTSFLASWDHYPEFAPLAGADGEVWRNAYGVCDSAEQLLEHFPELEAPGRSFVVTLTEVCRADQPAEGGWRWHKWGPYIGKHDPQHEYLHDEQGIDAVLVYHIYEYIDYDVLDVEQLKKIYKKRCYREFDSTSPDWRGDSDGAVRGALLHALKGR